MNNLLGFTVTDFFGRYTGISARTIVVAIRPNNIMPQLLAAIVRNAPLLLVLDFLF